MRNVNMYIETEYKGTLSNGSGSWHVILEEIYEKNGKEIPLTLKDYAICEDITRNRLELMAIVKGLEHMNIQATINVYTKSDYVHSAFVNGWIDNWIRNNFKSKGKEIKHSDLWKKMAKFLNGNDIRIIKVKEKTQYSRCQEIEMKKLWEERNTDEKV